MNLIERLKGMWRSHDEKLAEDAAGHAAVPGEDLSLTPGLDRQIARDPEAIVPPSDRNDSE